MGPISAMFKRVVKTSLRHFGYDLVQYIETPERPAVSGILCETVRLMC